MSFDQQLTPEQRKKLGRIKGAYAMHARHPEMAREAGSKGGKSYVQAHPEVHRSSHGRRLALSRKPRWEQALAERIQREEASIE